MRTTIKDIAEYTGFSVTTISLVLNGKGTKIPEKTKQIIFKAVEDLDYRPNQIAVGLVKKRTNTIGLIISDIRNVFFSNLAKGIEDECRRNGWNLVLCNTNDMHERDMAYIRVLADKGVDGILYAMSIDSDHEKAMESLTLMDSIKIPYIMIDRTFRQKCCHYVVTDHEVGGYLATKHLTDLGHRRIACVTGPLHLDDSKFRLDGYRRALEEASIPYDPALIYEGDYTVEGGREGINKLLSETFTAVFAFNDMSAYGVYNVLKANGYNIPDDISLVGYDNIFFSELLDTPLTTIHQPIYEVGIEATKRLIEMNEKKPIDKLERVIEPYLVVRKSTSAVKLEKTEANESVK
ncbi:LacI family DNA-binding transcriptional regulator [Fusibacter paucivorans]|uniref:LacI family DNA-binding transcriptional regulator n=1 Tax=Fusibacter paucivorans TaxID=76009 RepID=A0ABS5PRK2_9FIRM|nr:LacI family DNA-binding transcriptional regulator [Fusibacter paucivorans]MBS7527517.1 LacI family DNA-binding transcriptional regulator [Fusibacter paucivorans]